MSIDDGVDAHRHERLDALFEVGADTDGGGAAQPAASVPRCVREVEALLDVLDRDQAGESAVGVDERQLLDAMLLEDRLGLVERCADLGGDEAVGGHELGDRTFEVGPFAEADVAVGEDADQAPVGVGDRHPGELELVHQVFGVLQQCGRRQGDRVGDHPRLRPLDLLHLGGLIGDRHVAVDHADAAVAGHGDGHASLGDLVHRCRHQGHGEFDVAGEQGAGVDGVRQGLGVAGDHDDVVERERLEAVEEFVVGIRASHTEISVRSVVWSGAVVQSSRSDSTRSRCSVACISDAKASNPASMSMGTVRGAEHRAVVDALVGHEVDHDAGGRPGALERLVPRPLDGARAGEVAGQCRMQVDHPLGEPAEEAHREDAHPAGEHDEVGVEAGDDVGEAGVVVGALLAGVHADVHGGNAGRVGTLECEHVGLVRHHRHDVSAAVGRRRRHR